MPSDSRGFSMRVNEGKAITELDCSFQRLGCISCLSTITFSPYVTHTPTYVHTLNIPHLFCFWEGGLSLLCSTYLSKLDAGSGCLTASVKLWCGSLILGSMHLEVFIIIIFKKVEETSWMEASGSAVHLGETKPLACWRWMESSGQGFGVPTIFQSYIPEGWFCLMNGLYCGEEVKRSMSLLSFAGVCMCHGGSCSHLVAVEDLNTFSGVFYQNRIVVSFWYIGNILQLIVSGLLWWVKML